MVKESSLGIARAGGWGNGEWRVIKMEFLWVDQNILELDISGRWLYNQVNFGYWSGEFYVIWILS